MKPQDATIRRRKGKQKKGKENPSQSSAPRLEGNEDDESKTMEKPRRRLTVHTTGLTKANSSSDSDASEVENTCRDTPVARILSPGPGEGPKSSRCDKDSFTLFHYLHSEVFGVQDVEQADARRRQRVYNFLSVPIRLEKVRWNVILCA